MCSGKIKEVNERVFHRREQHAQRSNAKEQSTFEEVQRCSWSSLYSSLNLLTPYYGYSESPSHVGFPLCNGLGSELFCLFSLFTKILSTVATCWKDTNILVLLAIDLQDTAYAVRGEKPYRKRAMLMEQTFNGRISAMAAILCSENVLGSFNLLFLGSHLSWPQIHLILHLKEIFVIAFLKEKRISHTVVTPVSCIRICCNVTKLSSQLPSTVCLFC